MLLQFKTERTEYPIVIEPGCIRTAGEYLSLNRKALIVTDDGVPAAYAEAVASVCADPVLIRIPSGEASKSIEMWEKLLREMLAHGFTRTDCVVAVGGGVVGDLAGFAAASFMRGIDFYNVPTTVLSQVDSSVGGKTAVDLGGIKNIVGAFHQPRAVLIDTDLLSTLPPRQVANGLAEAVKMSLTSDAELFSLLEAAADPSAILPTVVERSIRIKKAVVETDEREAGLRKILNFGHTIGHGIESLGGRYHGECVALGMLPMCSPDVRERLLRVLRKIGLPTEISADPEAVLSATLHDKKKSGDKVTVVTVEEVGKCRLSAVGEDFLRERITELVTGGNQR